MFDKVLVANRGEIAVRVMRACAELGVDTVAVYSDADKHAGHVRYADEAYNVGPARAADSYLDGEAVVEAAKAADADAIHPGYGFLAENADFAARVEATDGITWVGPSSDAMERLGEKTHARRVMDDADVPIVPGTTEPVTDVEAVTEFGDEHGYPVAIKAEGGGGGGRDESRRECRRGREGPRIRETRGRGVLLERLRLPRTLSTEPPHIEVQIVADDPEGNGSLDESDVVHLGERDCSLQRRYQKVIEEGLPRALRRTARADRRVRSPRRRRRRLHQRRHRRVPRRGGRGPRPVGPARAGRPSTSSSKSTRGFRSNTPSRKS